MSRDDSTEGLRCEKCGRAACLAHSCEPCPFCEVGRLETEVERLQAIEAWYIRVRQMIGDWYERRVGKPMTGHEADAITVMGARWRKDREEVERLRAFHAADHWDPDLQAYRQAPRGEGPHAATWKDNPHRLIYDLCSAVQRLRDEKGIVAVEEETMTMSETCPRCGAEELERLDHTNRQGRVLGIAEKLLLLAAECRELAGELDGLGCTCGREIAWGARQMNRPTYKAPGPSSASKDVRPQAEPFRSPAAIGAKGPTG